MIKLFIALYESNPKVIIRRINNQLYWQQKGREARRNAEIELSKIERPIYKIPNIPKTEQ